MGHHRSVRIAAVLGVMLCSGSSGLVVRAQTLKGTILGTITDSSQAVMPGVQVAVTETNTNARRTLATNDSGFYSFPNLDPGVYRVEVEHSGFRKMVRAGIDLTANTTARVDLELSVGSVSDVVDVTDTAPLLQTDRADTGGKIEQVQLQSMPMSFNRNYQSLIALLPGVGRVFRPNSEFYNSQDSLGARVNGMGRFMNNYQLEGVDNNFDNGALTGIVLPAEAIGSVDVSTSSYDPEFGNAGGAVTTVTMRSGTNQYHGSLFEYHQDRALRATQPFAATKPQMIYNQFGGTFGGRVIRDKLFFFGDYQGSRDRFGSSNLATIPTVAFRTGDLSASPTTVYDPATGNADGTGRQPFSNNRIPAGQLSPVVQKILANLPAPTSPGLQTNFQKNTARVKSINSVDGKVDWVAGPNDRFAVRYNYQKAFVTDPVPSLYGIYGGPHNSGFDGYGPARTQSAGVTYSRIFSPTLMTEIRTGFVRNRNESLPLDYGLKTATELGIPGINLDAFSTGMPALVVNGYDTPLIGYSGALPMFRAVTNWGVVDNWTKTAGTHVIKWGLDLRRQRNDLNQPVDTRGRFSFTEGPAALNGDSKIGFGNAFASLLLDRPNSISRGFAGMWPTRREWIYNLYFQDKWQISQKLTVDLGLRWEYWPAGKPAYPGGYSNYDPTNNTLVIAGIGNNPMDMGINNSLTHFAPRLGIAYRLNEKTVLRAGYGISYLPRVTAVWNFPISQANAFSAPNSFSPAGSLATGIPAPDLVQIPASGILAAPLNQTYRITPKDWKQGYVQSWNIAVQRALPSNFSLDLAYVGNHTVNAPAILETNYGRILGGGPASQPLRQLFGRTASTATLGGTPAFYDGLQVKLNRKSSSGFMLTTSYTFSKAIDYYTDFDTGVNPGKAGNPYIQYNLAMNRARGDFDVTHVYVQSFIYELPFGAGKRWMRSGAGKWILGGWQANGIFTAQTGTPLNITFSNSTLNTPLVNNRPSLVSAGQPEIYRNVGANIKWFDTSKFAAPLSATFGNVGRNILSGPAVANLDFALSRTFLITERVKAQLRMDGFNLTNTPHYDNPNTTFGSSTFGQVTTAGGNYGTGRGDPRQFQVSARVFF
jgi:hypothetical protein